MKDTKEIIATVVDFGSFISLAQKLSETYAKVNYHTPIDREFRSFEDAAIGYGVSGLVKIESFMSQQIISETDLFIFPDIGYGAEQQYLRSIGKQVWGSMGADEFERLRTLFVETVKSVGLPLVPSKSVAGVPALREFLKSTRDKWVKINEFRADMETWKHIDYDHSIPKLAELELKFGTAKWVRFVIQDDLPGATEIGYDGWNIDGWFPDSSFQGYEAKNEAYIGAQTAYDDLPEEIRLVNEKFSKVLEEYQYRNFIATEIRNFDGTPYFIDPTQRCPGQTSEYLWEICPNMPEIVWKGSAGEFVQPKWDAKFGTTLTLHSKMEAEAEKIVRIPDDAKQFTKLTRFGIWNGVYHVMSKRDDVGAVIGFGDTIEEAMKSCTEHFDLIGDDSLSVKKEAFAEILKDIHSADEDGIEFSTQEIPEPADAIA